VFAFMNDMGWRHAKEFTPKFIEATRSKFLTTVGCCGSKRDMLQKKVFTFVEAKYLEDDTVKTISLFSDKATVPVDAWRQVFKEKNYNWLQRPNSCVFTSEQDQTTERIEPLLMKYQCQAVDMETAAIFLALKEWNDLPENQFHEVFPALSFKGVSDSGSSKERDLNLQSAVENATTALLLFIEYICSFERE